MITIEFHGAARQVTGSCHLVEADGHRFLVDCGLFQGGDAVERANAAEFGFDPASIDAVLLTHAHLDHCGRLPLLVKRGFRGEIVATPATRELARLVLTDAASLQEEDARSRARRSYRGGHRSAPPLYTLDDAFLAMDSFGRSARYGEALALGPEVQATFVDAGHLLGSASILLEIGRGGAKKRLLFSGDLGNPGRPLLREAPPPPHADVAVVESTYGDRDHRSAAESSEELIGAIAQTLDRGGNAIVPTFALERAQEVLLCIADAVRARRLPARMPVFLDSPMAISATGIFRRHADLLAEPARRRLEADDPFGLPGLRYTRDVGESMAINRIEGGAVILAGSGMCTGGRVLHHLKHHLWRKESAVIFVGYAAEGTLARRIIDGSGTVRLFNEDIRVRAKIWTINGFSAHAGRSDLLRWIGEANPGRVFLVHGEPDRGMDALAGALAAQGVSCATPGAHERIEAG